MSEKPIHHECTQNSEEWLKLRTGLPTASRFGSIITPAKGELSKQADEYMNYLIAESMVGHVIEFESKWMERGHELESEAVKAYELLHDVDTLESGFWTNAEGTFGASPDRLIGEDALLEIKCPAAHTHIGYMLTKQIDRTYYPQLMGQLYVTQRKYVDIISYFPELPMVTIRVEWDEEYIAKMSIALTAFVAQLAEKKKQLETQYKV